MRIFFRRLLVMVAFMLVAFYAPAYACTETQITVGNSCVDTKFSVTTPSLDSTKTFEFYISASGTFYVDCGVGGTLNGTGVSGKTITRNDVTEALYTCSWSTDGIKNIKFAGLATGYSTDSSTAAIKFSTSSKTYLASIDGSLGAIFPTLGSGNNEQPRFHQTFYQCSRLTQLPANLFSGVTGSASYMFRQTFQGCTRLESIPEGLFSGISGGSGATRMFNSTFNGCTGLTGSIPENLFSGITNAANYMFYYTFNGCSGLTGFVPPSAFSGLKNNNSPTATSMWVNTFANTGIVTSCPPGTTDYTTGYETVWATDSGRAVVSCSPIPYNITYVLNGGTNYTNAPTSYLGGIGITIDGIPTRPDYVFAGWCTDSALTNCAGTQTISTQDTGDKTFYAKWTEQKFSITTTNLPDNTEFKFTLSAYGTFYVDCGENGTLSGTGVSGNTITRSGGASGTYTCTYSLGGVKTIQFDGLATRYIGGVAIQFGSAYSTTPSLIAAIHGSLGAIFPTLNIEGVSNNRYLLPNFSQTFYDCTGLTSIPANLFSGITTAYPNAFDETFYNCTGLTSIPENLFSGISGVTSFGKTFFNCTGLTSIPEGLFSGVSGSVQFYATFYNCRGLTSIPENLFSHVSGSADYMFNQTFYGCTGLTSIPGNLFSHLSGNADHMFYQTFSGCKGLTSIPENLFSHVSGNADYMFDQTFYGCTGLTSIPGNLFSGITGAAPYMFQNTFYGCTGLTSIPGNLFSHLSGSADYMFFQTFYGCTGLTSIPENLFSHVSGNAPYMFQNTFYGCTGLTSVHENLFSGVTGAAPYMFSQTFYNCSGLTSIPGDLFSGVSGSAERLFEGTFYGCSSLTSIPGNLFTGIDSSANNMFRNTFYNCSGLTAIPENLFANVTGAGATRLFNATFAGCTGLTSVPENLFAGITDSAGYMFASVFSGCTNLSGYIPPSTFAGLIAHNSPTASNMWTNAFSRVNGMDTACPVGTTSYTTGYETDWGNKVSCTENSVTCAGGTYRQAYKNICSTCPVNSYCPGGTYGFNASNDQGVNACPNSWFAPAGSASVGFCGRKFRVGNDTLYLRSIKQTTPSLNVKIGDDVFYANITTANVPMNSGTSRKIKVRFNNITYSVYDDTITP